MFSGAGGTQCLQVHRGLCLTQVTPSPNAYVNYDTELILDTGETFSSVKNRELLAGVYTSKKGMMMLTNAGEREIEERGELLGMKENPWLDEESLANVISFSELMKQY